MREERIMIIMKGHHLKLGGLVILRVMLLVTMLLMVPKSAYAADISWGGYTIAPTFDSAASVYAIDVDGDGDIDVLGAASIADDITW